MLPAIESTKKLSFECRISDGDLVIVCERHDNVKVVKVFESGSLHNRFGVFKQSDWIGKPFGSKVFSNKGGFIYLLAPTPVLWTLILSYSTQILYIAGISFVNIGSLTTSLARAIAPSRHVYIFDFHEQWAASARDIQGEGFSDEFSSLAASIFLYLPQPWLTIPSTGKVLKQDGVLCSFSPCIEQV
ncbi:hypothetical protein M9H77_36516 [Catharanthus roseus]|uniref:Uncharacterized protein n=1 Tax=Catharanthus roseus TaxID=4058 RepID=A0ACB9ZS06_CATRO|nr:hypothetical protein M9H77_36516 [Catharanthus roseus]